MDLPREIGQRVGVLGGTFDPVHNGHLAVAEAACRGLDLDGLLLIPAAVPPHKRELPITPFAHRLTMLRLAVADRAGLYVSSVEADRGGPSFSVDTLVALRGVLGRDVSLFFLVGIDAFGEISTWKEYLRLPLLAELVVVDRPAMGSPRLDEAVRRQFPDYLFDSARAAWLESRGSGVIRPLTMAPLAVSSTQVRQLVAAGKPVSSLVPAPVVDYIRGHHLYGA